MCCSFRCCSTSSWAYITVEKRLNNSLPGVSVDEGQLQQVLINLLVNAADAIGDDGGTISVITSAVQSDGKEYAQIEVADTGCGIAQENLTKVFEPFYSTKEQKGIGLGLSIVWGIIDKHQGTIAVDSEPGEGATFTIRLPAGRKDALIRET